MHFLSRRCVALKASRSQVQQLRGHGQIGLGPREIDVTQIGSQKGKTGLHLGALAVPGDETMDSKGVPQIMQAWLPALRSGPMDANMLAEANEDLFEAVQ